MVTVRWPSFGDQVIDNHLVLPFIIFMLHTTINARRINPQIFKQQVNWLLDNSSRACRIPTVVVARAIYALLVMPALHLRTTLRE